MAEDDRTGKGTLCWDCMKVGWWCLCPLPARLPAGAVGGKVILDGFEGWRVDNCPLFWPDIERHSSKLKVSDSPEEIKQKELMRAAYFQRYDNRPGRSMSGTERAYLFSLFKENNVSLGEIGRVAKSARVIDEVIMIKVDDEYCPVEEVYKKKPNQSDNDSVKVQRLNAIQRANLFRRMSEKSLAMYEKSKIVKNAYMLEGQIVIKVNGKYKTLDLYLAQYASICT